MWFFEHKDKVSQHMINSDQQFVFCQNTIPNHIANESQCTVQYNFPIFLINSALGCRLGMGWCWKSINIHLVQSIWQSLFPSISQYLCPFLRKSASSSYPRLVILSPPPPPLPLQILLPLHKSGKFRAPIFCEDHQQSWIRTLNCVF